MAQAEKIVLDASVVVKWFTKEEYSMQALAVKTKYESGEVDIVAPQLLIYEVVNALRYNPAFGSDELRRAVHDLEDMQITLYPLEADLAELTVEQAYRFGLSIFDAAYVALAFRLNSKYYTADIEVVKKTSSQHIRHISEYRPVT
ncbi:MAG: type II toxin-antitoxin system VapC family toxin [Candidatus Caldarchaeum sp.]